ncbi:MAG: uroporphyrinogen-III synthase [Thiohalomonadales bacterium]
MSGTDLINLSGVCVVVTRPQHQADGLCRELQALGARVIRLPVIAIAEPENSELLTILLKRLIEFDTAVFISANAVDQAMKYLNELGQTLSHLKIVAVGKASAKALQRHGVTVDIVPQGKFNSEALLLHADLQRLQGRRMVIFRGEGGREYLANRLIERGAQVEYAECYRRVKPSVNAELLLKAWARDEIDVVTLTSNESLHNLYDIVGKAGQRWLQKTALLGVSERLRDAAIQLDLQGDIRIADNASDKAIITALTQWFTRVDKHKNRE